jgi:hypothetical protein
VTAYRSALSPPNSRWKETPTFKSLAGITPSSRCLYQKRSAEIRGPSSGICKKSDWFGSSVNTDTS